MFLPAILDRWLAMNRLLPFLLALLLLLPAAAIPHSPSSHGFRLTPFRKGFPAPPFQLTGLSGKAVSLSDFRGRVVLLNFWATWCAPCVREMPSMEKLYQAFRERGLVVLAVSLDEEGAAKVEPFVRKLGLTFPIVLDTAGRVSGIYGARELPASFLIDGGGAVFAAAKGERDWFSPAARSYFDEKLPPAGRPRTAAAQTGRQAGTRRGARGG